MPFDADTTGFGQAIAAALAHGVQRLVLGIGSSASTDCGVGLLRALGGRFSDHDGSEAAPGLRGLASIVVADLTDLLPPPAGGAVVLSDVTNPLLGPSGRLRCSGPRRESGPKTSLRRPMPRPRRVPAARRPGDPGCGCGGGSGFALLAWGAQLVPGRRRWRE
nr:glycerate kinase [Tessaracoccus coleopterorum]